MDMSFAPAAAGERIHVLQLLGQAIVGGMERCVLQLAARLPRACVDVTVLCPEEGELAEQLRAAGTEVVVTPVGEEPPWASVQLVATLARAHGIDVLHAHMANAHLLAALAGRLAQRPVVATVHSRQVSLLDLELHRSAGTHLSVVCQQSYYHALGVGVDAARLSCIPNGVDTDLFHPRDEDSGSEAGSVRRTLGIPPDVPVVAFVGRLSPEKGPEVFVRTALHLHTRWPQARFVLIGDGPQRASLQALADRHGLAGQVLFAGAQADMPARLREVDLVVSSSWSEAMPLTLLEALASALPVVATRVGGVPEMVAPGRTGFLATPGDHEALAAHVDRLLADPVLRRAMGACARACAVERFGVDASVQRTAQLLQQLARPCEAARAGAVVQRVPAAASGR